MSGRIKITTIMDNVSSAPKLLKGKHGLSFCVETESCRVLFDFGAGKASWKNARKLGFRPEAADFAVGSHGHYDHADGLPFFVEHGLKCPFVTGAGFFRAKYDCRDLNGSKAAYLGCSFDEAWLMQHGISHRICDSVLELSEDCYVVGGFERFYEFETIPERFVLREEGRWIPDPFDDEVCLALKQQDGLVVIAGCSHPGILNILETVRKRFHSPVKAVFGGIHLNSAKEERVRKTVAGMKQMGIQRIGVNHCSGNLVQEILKEEAGLDICYLGAGDCLFLE